MNAIPNWKLERYRLKELPEADAREIDAALATDPSLRERLAALDRDDAATLAAHPPARVAARISLTARDSIAPRRGGWRVPVFALAAMALAGVVAVALRPPPDADVIRPKGQVSLRLFKLEAGT